jgi:hypothetical protein
MRWKRRAIQDNSVSDPEIYELRTRAGILIACIQRNRGEGAWFWYGTGMNSLWPEYPAKLLEEGMPRGYYSSLVNAQMAAKKWIMECRRSSII